MVGQVSFAGGASVPLGAAPQPILSHSAPVSAPVPASPSQATNQVPVAGSGSQEAAVAQVNQHLAQTQTDLKLSLDTGSGRTVYQLIQQGTGQVLLQVPSAEVLGMSQRVRDLQDKAMASGGLVDRQG